MRDFAEELFDKHDADQEYQAGEEDQNGANEQPTSSYGITEIEEVPHLQIVANDTLDEDEDADVDEDSEISDAEAERVITALTEEVRHQVSSARRSHRLTPGTSYFLLQQFMKEADKPLLTQEEVLELGRRIQANERREEAMQILVGRNVRFAVKIAYQYKAKAKKMSFMDVIQEACLGLMHAAGKFDPNRKTKFTTYSAYWIKAYIRMAILRNQSLIKRGTTQRQRKVFSNISRIEKNLRTRFAAQGEYREPTAQEIADEINREKDEEIAQKGRKRTKDDIFITEADVTIIRTRNDAYLDTPMGNDDDGEMTHKDVLPSKLPSPENNLALSELSELAHSALQEALQTLPQREQMIVSERHFVDDEDKPTLTEMGKKLGISRERVRQLEARALRRMKEFIYTRYSYIPELEEYVDKL